MKITTFVLSVGLPLFAQVGPNSCAPTSDQKQSQQQEQMLQEGTAETGMPNIQNFQERKTLKDILEMRDQANLATYTYTQALDGHLVFLGNTVGFGLPYSTQYTSPMRPATYAETSAKGNIALPQADPNGLFSPADAEGTWILMQNPANPKDVQPIYIEPRITTSPFPLPCEK